MHAVESPPPEPLRLFITGGAGTGKSHVISVVHEHFERAQIGDGCACMLMAPTGVAAFNIGGLTIHKVLNLPVEHGKRTAYRKLASERLHGMRRLWKRVTTIIIDEISMVSYQTLNFVHQRLTEIKGTDDTEVLFGGLNVIAVGDFFQLPPVRDKFIFQEGNGYNPDIFTMVELTINMRQMGDNTYSRVLGRIRIGQQTPDDITLLRTHLTSGIDTPVDVEQCPFTDALRLLPLKVMVDEYNTHRLRQLAQTSTVFEFKGEHSIVDSDSARQSYGVVQHVDVPERLIPPDDNDCAGLPRSVKLAVGAQVMLRRNILCEDGLVNGARGIVVGFTWPNGQPTQPRIGQLPQNVLVKFHDPRVGCISRVSVEGDAEAVPIEPVTAKFYGREGVTLQRTQLPLLPCWAATIHKVQGLSLDAAVIDLGPKVFEDGMAYVALSRVRTLDGVAIIDLVSSKIKASQLATKELDRLRGADVEDREE